MAMFGSILMLNVQCLFEQFPSESQCMFDIRVEYFQRKPVAPYFTIHMIANYLIHHSEYRKCYNPNRVRLWARADTHISLRFMIKFVCSMEIPLRIIGK